MQSIDLVYIYGKKQSGLINLEEFQELLDANVYFPQIMDNIDECVKDEEDKLEKSGLSLVQQYQLLSNGRNKILPSAIRYSKKRQNNFDKFR